MPNTNSLNTFAGRTINELKDEIQSLYLKNSTPWVIGYSGGKDSTAVVQLIYLSLLELPTEQRKKVVYVLSSDTKVETPSIVNHIDINLELIQKAAQKDGLPIEAVKVEPNVTNTFWVNLLGRGYPAPSQNFRWCTDRMKIKPANNFISDQVSKYGEVIMVLGVRSDESISRANTLKKNKDKYNPESLLSRHSTLSGAYVYPVIQDFSTDDVWTFLLQYESPWGFDNNSLLSLYRSANAGECPLVIDTSTSSCGNSRFGCWTCTVVTQDKALSAMVDNGEDWLEPLLDFRDMLASTQTPEGKKKYRSHKRRNGQVNFITRKTKVRGESIREEEYLSSELAFGPYKFEYLKYFLEELLKTEKAVNDSNPSDSYFELVSIAELEEIRKFWKMEQQDWEDSVPQIYEKVMQKDYPMKSLKGGGFTGIEYQLLDRICQESEIPTQLVAKLLDTARSYDGLKRRSKALDDLKSVITEEWRSPEEILEARKKQVEKRTKYEEVQ
ncbi:MAG: DNA phosphorothioation system sulfurtransferase DndC [Bacteriovoracaceae bacterium]|jgi:DNA sulfur modification protein DndC|nr:DNA phosphorothioation system sulfurtransferase DndC [Bacteriovoracaceae bacterium]